jgi:tRNA threonylcarbamoyladenosine biosynthesis protein TsaE
VSPAPNTLDERLAPITSGTTSATTAATPRDGGRADASGSGAAVGLQDAVAAGVGIHAPILGTSAQPAAGALSQRTWLWADEAACAAQATALARRPALPHAFIELHGPLGAGKTTFVRHLLRALGVAGRIKSPTYTVVESYVAQLTTESITISHCDFYRFADPREWADAGLRDLFSEPGLKLVEWAANAGGMLPLPDLRLQIEPVDAPTGPQHNQAPEADARRVLAQAFTARGVELLS